MSAAAHVDRDRFVAFAFTAADVVLEVDLDGTVRYAAGALERFAPGAGLLPGHDLACLFAGADRGLVDHLLGDVARGGRLGPVTVHADGTDLACELSLLKLPERPRVAVALRGLGTRQRRGADGRDPQTGLLRRQAFASAAERELLRHLGCDAALELSIVRVSGLDLAPGAIEAPAIRDFLLRVATLIRAFSIGGNLAADLGRGRFVLLQADGESGERLQSQLDDLRSDRDLAPSVAIERQSLPLDDPSLTPGQAAAALHYVIDRLGRADGSVVGLNSLAEVLAHRIADTTARVQQARATIDSRSFYTVFQPVVGLADGVVHHSEALSRLRSNEPIYEFVTFAETIGFIADFDYAVTRQVLDQLVRLGREGVRPRVAVNLSAGSLQNDAFVAKLLELCRAGGTTAKQVLFEITESFQLADLARAERVLQALRQAGHRVCLDDFGAGAAAYHYIRALTVDYVKLDGTFVQRMLETRRDAAVLRSMVELCGSLEVDTIAEMVETEAQATTLRELGVTLGQGFWFGRPVAEPLPARQASADLTTLRTG